MQNATICMPYASLFPLSTFAQVACVWYYIVTHVYETDALICGAILLLVVLFMVATHD